MITSCVSIIITPNKTSQVAHQKIIMSHTLARFWEIPIEEELILSVGTKQVQIQIELSNMEKNEWLLHHSLLSELSLPADKRTLLAHYHPGLKTIFIGPIIAVMTNMRKIDEENPFFGSIHSFCEELQQLIAQFGGLFYVFQIQKIHQEEIIGFYFDGDGWVQAELPFPNVIYNRIHSRKLETSSFFQEKLTLFQTRDIPIFNQRFLSKWEVHQTIATDQVLQSVLPPTILYTPENLQDFLKIYQDVYIKPVHGSQGKNILHLNQEENGLSIERTTKNYEVDKKAFHHISQFYQWFKPFAQKRSYIIQQTIPLLEYKERPIDFRILCHRNHQQDWKITSIVARVASSKQFVSNIASGGLIKNAKALLIDLFNEEMALQTFSHLKMLSLETARIISKMKHYPNCYELGLDIGIDRLGNLWLIEVNSKPSKDYWNDGEKMRPSIKAILKCCYSLAFTYIDDKKE